MGSFSFYLSLLVSIGSTLKNPRRGFNTANILKNAPKEFNETLGEDTFLVPLVTVSEREVHQLCEQEVLQAELAMQKRKVKDNDQKAKAEASASKVFVPIDLVSESDEETKRQDPPKNPEPPQETEKQMAARLKKEAKAAERAEKAAADKAKKEQARIDAKAVKEIMAKNKKLVQLATSALSILTPCIDELAKVLKEKQGEAEDDLKSAACDQMGTLRKMRSESSAALKEHSKSLENPLSLSFENLKTVQEEVKNAKFLKDRLLGKKAKRVPAEQGES